MTGPLTTLDYEDYREYLHEWFWTSKKSNPKLSFRFVSKQLSLKAPNHFHLVITKRRHLSPQVFEKVLRLIRLEPRDRQYLKLLFKENISKDLVEKVRLAAQRKLLQSSPSPEATGSDQLQLVGHSLAWYLKMGAIFFEGKTREEIVKIAVEKSRFPCVAEDVNEAIELLLRAQQLEFVDGISRFEGGAILTKWDFDSEQVKRHHRANLNLAIDSVAWPVDQRFLTSVTVPCSPELYQSVISEVRALCLSVLEKARAEALSPTDVNRVATLQFALFPYFKF